MELSNLLENDNTDDIRFEPRNYNVNLVQMSMLERFNLPENISVQNTSLPSALKNPGTLP